MSGHVANITDLTAKQIADRYRVSLRTARRHRQRGTLPDERRTVGMDGKTYPGSAASYQRNHGSNADDDLRMARNALRRFARKPRFVDEDVEVLRNIQQESLQMLNELVEQIEGQEK